MESGKAWTFEKDEKLIELVKTKPGLYDIQTAHYSDNNYKRNAWHEIGKELNQHDAKARWENLRSQYRKYLNKLNTKSGQSAKKISKWRFSDQMLFLNEYINSARARVSSIPDEETCIEAHKVDAFDVESEPESRQNNNTGDIELNTDSVVTAIAVNKTSLPRKIGKKETNIHDNASTALMKYILEKKEQENAAHPIDKFFSLMAATVKNFKAIDQHFVKRKIFSLVSEIEEKYLTDDQTPSSLSRSSSSPNFIYRSLLPQTLLEDLQSTLPSASTSTIFCESGQGSPY